MGKICIGNLINENGSLAIFYLEQENPHCFDDADAKFIDLYMKSGLFITEIVKRLYNSEAMKLKFPDDTERLNHIFTYYFTSSRFHPARWRGSVIV